MKDCEGRERRSSIRFYNKFRRTHHNYTTIEQYSQISDGFYRMYKGTGWEGTTSGIMNADQTKRGRIERRVYGEDEGKPDLQMCRVGKGRVTDVSTRCTRVFLVSLFVDKRATGKGRRVTVDQVR